MFNKLDQALHHLDQVWPEAALEIRSLVQDAIVSLNPEEHWTIPHFVEALLRESGRVALMLRQAQDPLLRDDLSLHPHLDRAFVHQRICKGLMRYATAGPHLPERAQALGLLEQCALRLKEDVSILRAHAQWTPAGERLFGDIEKFGA